MEELEGYNKQVEEFTTYGDMSEIQKWVSYSPWFSMEHDSLW